jgi:hypothetical protein
MGKKLGLPLGRAQIFILENPWGILCYELLTAVF